MSSGVSIKVVGNWIEKETDDVFLRRELQKTERERNRKKEILGAKTKHEGEGFSTGFFLEEKRVAA